MKNRLDSELVRRGLARSRESAADLIESRSVLVNGIPATKSASQVDAETSIVIQGERDDFVSRGGHKLAGALDAFPEIKVEDALPAFGLQINIKTNTNDSEKTLILLKKLGFPFEKEQKHGA